MVIPFTTAREQLIFLRSANRTGGTPAQATYTLDSRSVACRQGEKLTVGLKNVIVPRTWPQIATGVNDTFKVDVGSGYVTYTIPQGSFNFKHLAMTISRLLLPAMGACTWDSSTNKFSFTFAGWANIIITDALLPILGWPRGYQNRPLTGEIVPLSGSEITSTQICDSGDPLCFVLKLEGVNAVSWNYEGLNTVEPKPCNLLAVIPCDVAPYGVINYSDNHYRLAIENGQLQEFTLTWYDDQGNLADYIPNHFLQLAVGFVAADQTTELLQGIDQAAKDIMVQIHLQS